VEPARRARDVVRDTLTFVTQNRDTLIAAGSTESWTEAADHLWALDRAAEIALHPTLGSAGSTSRDHYMAETIQRILDADRKALVSSCGHTTVTWSDVVSTTAVSCHDPAG